MILTDINIATHTIELLQSGVHMCLSHVINKEVRWEAENRCGRVWGSGNLITVALV